MAAFFVATLGVTADAQPLTFNDPTVTDRDRFGSGVALDGNNVLIGASGDDTLGSSVGQAHLFTLPSLLGDFDFDRDGDGFDFLKWQLGESPSPLSQSDLADWEANYGKTISLTEPGDFDKDLDVDKDDLTKWEGDYGVNGNSDANGDGISDGRDFLIWQQNEGTMAPLSATSAAVPEPTAAALALAALCLAMSRRRI